jgi:hypothetical protein
MPESIAPSSRPPPTTGGAVYVIAALVLVAAIGGLVCWKLKGSNETHTPVATAPIATGPSGLSEPPPPPPPVEVDAGQVEDSGAARSVQVSGYNPCTAKCAGTANAALQSAIAARAGSARPCYERALRVNSALQGKLKVNVRVDPQGNVCGASVSEDAMHSAEVSNCVVGMFRSARFPPATGGCVDIAVPLSFVPREGK